MLLSEPITGWGDLLGVVYDFEKSGDVLPKHTHSKMDSHISVIVRGRLKISSHDWEIVCFPGNIIDLKENIPHEFTALEDNTRVVNILKKIPPKQGVTDE